jgi:putative transposase
MGRVARVVVPGIPHHVTQRGNRKLRVFFTDKDYAMYVSILSKYCTRYLVDVWAYCLMPNHVHIIAVPESGGSLARAVGETHRQYTLRINERESWTGHLWQGRFSSYPMDEQHLLAAARYIELNPVRAGLAEDPVDWRWSSARFHVQGKRDPLVKPNLLSTMVGDWAAYLREQIPESEVFRKHQKTGRPLGDEAFIERCEQALGRTLKLQKPGRKSDKRIEVERI